ncbi:MAG TPA: hypothetical protein VF120_06075 [Ktedonobacterales bacterium]
MRFAIAFISTLALGCLAGGLILFSGTYTSGGTQSTSDLRMSVFALGFIFFAVLGERLAIGLAFAHSHRNAGRISSLVLALCCLVMMLDSLFFALRVRGVLTTSWTLFGLPPEEALPPVEVALFAPVAWMYGVWPAAKWLFSAAPRGLGTQLSGRQVALGERNSEGAQA